jgi:hypothetical protein
MGRQHSTNNPNPLLKKHNLVNVKYFGPGQNVITSITTTRDSNGKILSNQATNNVQQPTTLPFSNCYETFNSVNEDNGYNVNNEDEDNIETKKIFCFNGAFTILTIFILVLLLIFINVNSKVDKLK